MKADAEATAEASAEADVKADAEATAEASAEDSAESDITADAEVDVKADADADVVDERCDTNDSSATAGESGEGSLPESSQWLSLRRIASTHPLLGALYILTLLAAGAACLHVRLTSRSERQGALQSVARAEARADAAVAQLVLVQADAAEIAERAERGQGPGDTSGDRGSSVGGGEREGGRALPFIDGGARKEGGAAALICRGDDPYETEAWVKTATASPYRNAFGRDSPEPLPWPSLHPKAHQKTHL